MSPPSSAMTTTDDDDDDDVSSPMVVVGNNSNNNTNPTIRQRQRQRHHRDDATSITSQQQQQQQKITIWIQIFIFGLLGVGVLAPWNAFISAKEYFDSRFQSCSSNSNSSTTTALTTTALANDTNTNNNGNIETTFAIWYNLSSVLSMGFILLFQWIRDNNYFSFITFSNNNNNINSSTTRTTMTTTTSEEAEQEEEEQDLSSGGEGLGDDDDENNIDGITRNQQNSNSNSNKTTGSSSSSYGMVMIPIGITLIVFLLQSVLVVIVNVPSELFQAVTLSSVSICGICSSIATAGVVATAGLFSSQLAMNPFLAGQSVSGVLISLASFFASAWGEDHPTAYWKEHCDNNSNNTDTDTSKATSTATTPTTATTSMISRRELYYYYERPSFLDDEEDDGNNGTCTPYNNVDWATFVYFLVGSLTLIGCLFGYAYIDRASGNNEYETVIVVEEEEALTTSASTNHHGVTTIDVSDSSPRIGLEMNDTIAARNEEEEEEPCAMEGNLHNNKGPTNSLVSPEAPREEAEDDDEPTRPHPSSNETAEVFSKIKGPATAVFLAFFVTLSLFPGLTSTLTSVRQCKTKFRLSNDLYTPFTFVLFNIGDLTGRLLSARLPLSRIKHLSKKLVVTSILRLLFFPLLFLCVCSGGGSDATTATANRVQIPSDIFSIVVQFLFAVSNGCLVSSAFAHAPTLLHSTSHEQERMSEVLTFSLVFGLLSGSLFSWPVSKLASS